jgi:hypothetical protein
MPRDRSIALVRAAMALVAMLLFPAATAAGVCPLELLRVQHGSVFWGGLEIGATTTEVEKQLGSNLDLRDCDESTGWPERSAHVTVDGQKADLFFAAPNGTWKLVMIAIWKAASDREECWTLEALRSELKRRVPTARFHPSRHAPEMTETDPGFASYLVAEKDSVIVGIAPPEDTLEGRIFIGMLEAFD